MGILDKKIFATRTDCWWCGERIWWHKTRMEWLSWKNDMSDCNKSPKQFHEWVGNSDD